jgi:sugar transferase EpsL
MKQQTLCNGQGEKQGGSSMKRIMDVIISFILLLLLSPILFTAMLVIKMKMGSPVFFKQSRPGLQEVPFELLKFRTMSNKRNQRGELLPDHLRLTQTGKFIRRHSIDELPQLLNVLKGEMSLVGPRPLLMEYLPLYTAEQRVRHHVKPGVTGWAQVNGRNAITWEEKFKLDGWYVKNQSIGLDFKILFATIYKVVRKDGITQQDHATAEKFNGSDDVI